MPPALKINGEKEEPEKEDMFIWSFHLLLRQHCQWRRFSGRTAKPPPNFLRGRQIPGRGRSRAHPWKSRNLLLSPETLTGSVILVSAAPRPLARSADGAVPRAAVVCNSARSKFGRRCARSLDSESSKRRHGPAPPPGNGLQLSLWQREDGAIVADRTENEEVTAGGARLLTSAGSWGVQLQVADISRPSRSFGFGGRDTAETGRERFSYL